MKVTKIDATRRRRNILCLINLLKILFTKRNICVERYFKKKHDESSL